MTSEINFLPSSWLLVHFQLKTILQENLHETEASLSPQVQFRYRKKNPYELLPDSWDTTLWLPRSHNVCLRSKNLMKHMQPCSKSHWHKQTSHYTTVRGTTLFRHEDGSVWVCAGLQELELNKCSKIKNPCCLSFVTACDFLSVSIILHALETDIYILLLTLVKRPRRRENIQTDKFLM